MWRLNSTKGAARALRDAPASLGAFSFSRLIEQGTPRTLACKPAIDFQAGERALPMSTLLIVPVRSLIQGTESPTQMIGRIYQRISFSVA